MCDIETTIWWVSKIHSPLIDPDHSSISLKELDGLIDPVL